MRTRLLPIAAVLLLALAACSGGSDTPKTSTSTAGGGGGGGGSKANGYEGTIATSGVYAATWTALAEAEVGPFNAYGALSLASDKQTFGNMRVEPDGSVSFGSTAPEFGKNGAFTGTGATVTLDPTNRFVCSFKVDAELTGTTDGMVIHLKGTMTVHWHPEGLGDLNCP